MPECRIIQDMNLEEIHSIKRIPIIATFYPTRLFGLKSPEWKNSQSI